MPSILLHLLPNILATGLYAALGYHFWHTRWRETDKPLAAHPMLPWERLAIGGTRIGVVALASLKLLPALRHLDVSGMQRVDSGPP